MPLVAQYASEWNAVFVPANQFRKLSLQLDELLDEAGRWPQDVRRSLMTGLVFGRTEAELQAKLATRTTPADMLREHGLVVGTGTAVQDQLGALHQAGVQRVMLQWLDLDDLDGLSALTDCPP